MFSIKAIIKNFENGKAAGYGITSEMIKNGGDYLFLWLSALMGMCAVNEEVLNDWKKAIIVSIYMGKRDKGDCNNYIAISLLNNLGKIFSKILFGKVMKITKKKIWEVCE